MYSLVYSIFREIMWRYGHYVSVKVGHVCSDVFGEKLVCVIRDEKPGRSAMYADYGSDDGRNHFCYL